MKIKSTTVKNKSNKNIANDTKILDILCIFMFIGLFILVGVIFACLLIILI